MGAKAPRSPSLSRRSFLIAAGGAGAGLVLGFSVVGCQKEPGAPLAAGDLNAWLSIAPDNTVTIRVTNIDMGQGAQTGLAQALSEELAADWSRIRVEMAPVSDPYLGKDGDDYYTGGSGSIRRHFDDFRHAGAAARAMLIAAAAERWGVAPSSCSAENGAVTHVGSRRSLSYGDLAEAAARQPVPADLPLKPRSSWTLIGKPVARLDLASKVNGRAVYGIDTQVPSALVATLAQCPYFEGSLQGVDEKPALAIAGVRQVVKLDNAVAVVAADFWTAKKGLDALAPAWTRPEAPVASDAAMFARLRSEIGAADSTVATFPPEEKVAQRRVKAAFASAHRTVEAEYQMPLLSHSPIEPMNAIAHVTAGRCELWAPMQDQGSMRDALAEALKIPKQAVVLHSTTIGGGLGRRLQTDYGVLAARVAQRVGQPTKLVWTREEDITHDFYRPATVGRVRAALDKDMGIRALEYVGATTNDTAVGGMGGNYGIDLVVRQKNVKMPLPIGAWRSVDASITVFLLESLVDEVAHAAGEDPIAYRRRLLAGKPRELSVLDTAAEMAGWGHAPDGRFQGVAFFRSSGWETTICEIAELSVDTANTIKVHRVFCALDCGTAVNPDAIEAQVQGGIILGLSAALGEAVTLKDGRVEQSNFNDYAVLRLAQTPEIQVQVLETPDAPIGGIGEPPVPPIAPAIANALFAATGKRIRSLPLANSGFRA
jgi:isoquinoline 1-oxidoreductase beta subunit